MKKILLFATFIIALSFIKNSAIAQLNYIGGGIALATGAEYNLNDYLYYNKSFGIDLRASYDYSKKLKIVPDFKIYLPNKEEFITGGESSTTVFVFNLNAHYILNPKTRETYRLYLLAGAHVGGWNITDNRIPSVGSDPQLDVKEFKFVPGGNIGGGMQFVLSNRILFFAEAKYVIAKTNQLVFSPGLMYEF
ncbi:MAG: outer membrane beta-barrel protein [Bacteroidales bacterium]|nr:outer membrane beta-barrel protein [Bacteroidales bacterium]